MPLIPQIYGFRLNVTISDLTAADVVQVVCRDCQHEYMIAPYQLLLRFRPQMLLVDLEKRFRCKNCTSVGRARYHVYRASPNLSEVQ